MTSDPSAFCIPVLTGILSEKTVTQSGSPGEVICLKNSQTAEQADFAAQLEMMLMKPAVESQIQPLELIATQSNPGSSEGITASVIDEILSNPESANVLEVLPELCPVICPFPADYTSIQPETTEPVQPDSASVQTYKPIQVNNNRHALQTVLSEFDFVPVEDGETIDKERISTPKDVITENQSSAQKPDNSIESLNQPQIFNNIVESTEIKVSTQTLTADDLPIEVTKEQPSPEKALQKPTIQPYSRMPLSDFHQPVEITSQSLVDSVATPRQESTFDNSSHTERETTDPETKQKTVPEPQKMVTEVRLTNDSLSSKATPNLPHQSIANLASSAVNTSAKGLTFPALMNQVSNQAVILKDTGSIDMPSLVNRIRLTLDSGQQELRLNLKPAILGRAVIILHRQDDLLHLDFSLEKSSARVAIETETPRLREALASIGFQNVNIDVHAPQNRNLDADMNPETSDRQQHFQRHPDHRQTDEPSETNRTLNPRMLGYNTFDLVA